MRVPIQVPINAGAFSPKKAVNGAGFIYLRPDRIVPDCLVFYLMSKYVFPFQEGTCLLDMMLHSGKINYAVQMLLGYRSPGEAMGSATAGQPASEITPIEAPPANGFKYPEISSGEVCLFNV